MMRNATSSSSSSIMIFLIIVAFIGGGISSGSGGLFVSGFVILPSSRSSSSAPFTNKITIQTQTRMRTALPITTTTATTSPTTTTTTTTDDDEEEDLTTSSSSSSSSSSSTSKIKSKNKDKSTSKKIRPIHKNWWPVACLSSLENDKPNSITLLNKKLVLFRSSTSSSSSSSSSDNTDDGSEHNSHDDDDDIWTCLDDRCSHRFAPLSEGRLVPSTEESEVDSTSSTVEGSKASSSSCTSCKIQCAYHGWEFDGKGSNTKIPQQQIAQRQKQKQKQSSSRQDVQSYPIRIKAGMIFIWSDPDSYDTIGKHIEIPVSKSTQDAYNSKGNIFQRDLPYGYELLGENLLDLSHLPFSHHSVGGLDRSLGTPLPFRMLNETEKSALNDNEDSSSYPSTVTPLYEVEIMNASRSDPVLLSMKGTPDTATAHVGFYQPCHVRYNRVVPDIQSSQVILYFCPTSSTKSRVFLMNVFERKEKKQEVVDEDTSSPELLIETAEVSSSTSTSSSTKTTASKEPLLSSFYKRLKSIIQKKLFQIIIKIKFTPTYMHLMNHKIFDGDGTLTLRYRWYTDVCLFVCLLSESS
jgi:phenylpropionate dioxygenase-like ring-hydroxylating dioxygenase large terminal subunit